MKLIKLVSVILVTNSYFLFFGYIGTGSSQMSRGEVSDIIQGLTNDDEEIRLLALKRASEVQPNKEIVGAVLRLLNDKSARVRRESVSALGKFGPAAVEAIPTLVQTLTNKAENRGIRVQIALELRKIGALASEYLTGLLRVASDKNDDRAVRSQVLTLIGEMGTAAKHALPILQTLAKEEQSQLMRVKAWAAIAKVEIGNREAVGALIRFAENKTDRTLANHATAALVEIGEGKKLVPVLKQHLGDKDIGKKWSAAVALGEIGSAAADAVPQLVQRVKNQDEASVVRIQSVIALGKIGPAAGASIPTLRDVVSNDPLPEMRKVAAEALEKIKETRK